MMTTLKDIWAKRNARMVKTWEGADPSAGFNLKSFIEPESETNPYGITYNTSNWRDLTISDFRELLDDLFHENSSSKYFDKDHIKMSRVDTTAAFLVIYENTKTNITIVASGADQKYFTIYLNYQVYTVSWYKYRGRIDSIINNEYGQPINLVNFTDILVALELEDDFDEE